MPRALDCINMPRWTRFFFSGPPSFRKSWNDKKKSGAGDARRRRLKPTRGLTGETDGSDPAYGLGCRAWVLPKPCGFCLLRPVRLSAPRSLCLSVPLSSLTRQQSPAVCAAVLSASTCMACHILNILLVRSCSISERWRPGGSVFSELA